MSLPCEQDALRLEPEIPEHRSHLPTRQQPEWHWHCHTAQGLQAAPADVVRNVLTVFMVLDHIAALSGTVIRQLQLAVLSLQNHLLVQPSA